ncbi:MAG: pyrroline-5-carboxylate reductase [Muribaculaceae bacterium]|nr:pyrroline-5-carboxylate reductase [Muribaculaceae bacterium]
MRISVIGGGAMGTAFIEGLLISNSIKPSEISLSNPRLDKIKYLEENGVVITDSNVECARNADVVVIAVKPWILEGVIKEINSIVDPSKTEICLIVAGIPGADLKKFFQGSLPKNLSIVMPNTAMRLGKSMTFVVPLEGDSTRASELFEKVGSVKKIEERLLPAATTLASCGIAYGMRYVRAASEGGVELGFRAADAAEIVTQTLKGVVALLEIPGSHPETEIDKVTTPGGLTIRGLNAMEKAGFSNAVVEGLKASVK